MESELHIGQDGIGIKGRDALILGILIIFVCAVGYMLYDKMEKEEARNNTIADRLETLKQDHSLFRESVDRNTQALNDVTDQMALQSYLMVATPEQEKEARTLIGKPKLLQR